MHDNDTLARIVRIAVDYARKTRNLPSDKALAKALGMHPVTLWKYTQGDMGSNTAALITIIDEAYQAHAFEHSDAA